MGEIVYNLSKHTGDIYLPNAYWVTVDNRGEPTHIKQKAYFDQIEYHNQKEIHRQIFKIIEALSIEAIETRFITNKRKISNLDGLLENISTKTFVLDFIDRMMNKFIQLIIDNKLMLCINLRKDSIVSNSLLDYKTVTIDPLLQFIRKNNGIIYRLKLQEKEDIWQINTKKVIPVCNNPAWIVANNSLMKIAHINGNMVKPFREKQELFIPERIVKTYFEKFILKVVKKVDIEASGFEIITKNELQKCNLILFRNLFNKKWEISLRMIYPEAEFTWNDKKENKIGFEFWKDDIKITKIVRDRIAENKYILKLEEFGLSNISGNSFVIDFDKTKSIDQNNTLYWLINYKRKLQKSGFNIINPLFQKKPIILTKPQLKINTSKDNDWFDIHAIVKIGNISFPFSFLKQNILDNNPYYVLPSNEVFVIPNEWMIKYNKFFKFARQTENNLQMDKSQFTILEDIDIIVPTKKRYKEKDEFKIPKSLNATLRQYQLEGVKWMVELRNNNLGACLADDMGLGKTLQTITVLLHSKEQNQNKINIEKPKIIQLDLFSTVNNVYSSSLNALIIMPASLIFNWKSEIIKFAPSLKIYSFIGANRVKNIHYFRNFDIVLTTYHTALRDIEFLKEMQFEYVVLDESQQIKNRRSKIFNAITQLEANHKISLSGTPIENSLSDLWSQMQFINAGLLGKYKFFEREFLKPIEKYSDKEKVSQLKQLIRPFLLRRTKQEVEKHLPELQIKTYYSEMTKEQEKIYEKEKSAARNYLLKIFDRNKNKQKLEILQVLNRLRQIANHPVLVKKAYSFDSGKFNDILEQLKIIKHSGHKVLIFSSYVKHLELLKNVFEEDRTPFSYLTGALTSRQRKQQVERFENDDNTNIFLISIKAGGVGLNLTKADYVFIIDPWWNPTTEQQAIARAHRIGQEQKVIAIKFITRNTLEEKIILLQQRKSQIAEDILGNTKTISLTKNDIDYLLK